MSLECVCVNCGKSTKTPMGSLKHPYCKKCFKETFEDYETKKGL